MKSKGFIIFIFTLVLHNAISFAQGPKLAYYYHPETHLPRATCNIIDESGHQQKIGFFPVINELTNGPMGTCNYSADVNIKADLVFLGDGRNLIKKPGNYQHPEIAGKAVLFFDHLTETGQPGTPGLLEKRIETAMDQCAAMVVFAASDESFPLYTIALENEIPAISIDLKNAKTIFEKAGFDGLEMSEIIQKTGQLPITISLQVEGNFTILETENFHYHFQPTTFSLTETNRIKTDNEQAVDFLRVLFKDTGLDWSSEQITYFGNFESKIFYTGYWGKGFSCDEGVYNVYIPDDNSFGLAVHENTHSLLRKNGLSYCSFFDEGIARYAEASATGEDINNRRVAAFLRSDSLLRLEALIDINIGTNPIETKIGYPASGSFVQFLIEKHGTGMVLDMNAKAFDESTHQHIIALEKDWLLWLCENYNIDRSFILKQLKK